jgi:hypothetical protein
VQSLIRQEEPPRLDEAAVDVPAKWAFTGRAWERKHAAFAD